MNIKEIFKFWFFPKLKLLKNPIKALGFLFCFFIGGILGSAFVSCWIGGYTLRTLSLFPTQPSFSDPLAWLHGGAPMSEGWVIILIPTFILFGLFLGFCMIDE